MNLTYSLYFVDLRCFMDPPSAIWMWAARIKGQTPGIYFLGEPLSRPFQGPAYAFKSLSTTFMKSTGLPSGPFADLRIWRIKWPSIL